MCKHANGQVNPSLLVWVGAHARVSAAPRTRGIFDLKEARGKSRTVDELAGGR